MTAGVGQLLKDGIGKRNLLARCCVEGIDDGMACHHNILLRYPFGYPIALVFGCGGQMQGCDL